VALIATIITKFYNKNSEIGVNKNDVIKNIDERILTAQQKIVKNESSLSMLYEQHATQRTLMSEFEHSGLPNYLLINKKIDSINVNFDNKLDSINVKLSQLKELSIGLRQSINPENPEEILTIARLNDGLKLLVDNQKTSNEHIKETYESFEKSILRELKSSSNYQTLMLTMLIPLIVNFLLTLWKDKNKKTEE